MLSVWRFYQGIALFPYYSDGGVVETRKREI